MAKATEKPAATTGGKRPRRTAGPRREKKLVPQGQVHIQSTFNNTIVTVTDPQGNTVGWTSTGSAGFKGSRKSTPYAAQMAATQAARRSVRCKPVGCAYVRLRTSRRSRTTAAARPRSGASSRRLVTSTQFGEG